MDSTKLMHEASYFCGAIFGSQIPEQVAERYARAFVYCFPDADLSFQAKVDRLVRDRQDVEAIEFALRFSQPNNLLSKKIKILFYLLEVRAEFLPHFVNFDNRILLSYAQLTAALFYTAWKFIKGRILGWRYGFL